MRIEPDAECLRDADASEAFARELEPLLRRVAEQAKAARTTGACEALEILHDAIGDAIGALDSEAERLREDALETAAEYHAELRR